MSAGKNKQSLLINLIDITCLFFVKIIIGLIYFLPYSLAIWICRTVVLFIVLLMPRANNVALRNLELVFPEKSLAERKKIVLGSYQTLAVNLFTYAKIPTLTKKNAQEIVDFNDAEAILKKCREESPDTGIILPTLHFGCFEMLAQFMALLGNPFSFLARGFGLRRVDAWWNIRREMFGNKVFSRKGGYQEITDRIKSGEDVGVLFDQNVKVNHAVFSEFFGIEAATTKSVAIVALRTGAPILLSTCAIIGRNKYKLYAFKIHNPIDEEGTQQQKISSITRELHQRVEEVIRLHPEQWMWIHRRYKTRPPGEKENLYDLDSQIYNHRTTVKN